MQLSSYNLSTCFKRALYSILIYRLWNVNISFEWNEPFWTSGITPVKCLQQWNYNCYIITKLGLYISFKLNLQKIMYQIHCFCSRIVIATNEYDQNSFWCQVLQFQQQRNKQWVVVCYHYQVSFCLHASSIKTIIGSSSSFLFIQLFS